ncbi:protein NDNF-like [Ceratina calcarata]|uniref:Protein NDNF-like n=1 Tax=Ceratina calcarata TaxID=156304 RepID=A0AAJ7NFM4_9HYME|nr:protein NDNF-like [Ceratina calcarata]
MRVSSRRITMPLSLIFLITLASVFSVRVTGCAFCQRLSHQQASYKTIGSPRPFGAEKPTRVQEFDRTGVLHPEYQIPATLRPGNVSQFYYLSPREGPPLTLLVSPCNGPISWTVSYVEPPESSDGTEGTKSGQTRWPVKSLKPGSPLFAYEGAEDRNLTISKTRAGLYWFEIKSLVANSSFQNSTIPSTVLLYATSGNLGRTVESHGQANDTDKNDRRKILKFQQKRSKRRLTVSWNKSTNVEPHLSQYCLAVTSGSEAHPSTLCAAQNVLRVHRYFAKAADSTAKEQKRATPEGLYCVRQTKLTLHRMKYDTNYNFTLYVVDARNNVSNRVATDAIKFRRTPEWRLRPGRYITANLRKNDGYVNFRYRPTGNASTTFHILTCGGGVITAKLNGPEVSKETEVASYASLRVPLTSGKIYNLRISATPQQLTKVSAIKVAATQESSLTYPQTQPSRNLAREYRSLRKCHEVTVGVESAGTGKYCILVRELKKKSDLSLAEIAAILDRCGPSRKRRSEYEYAFEVCEEKQSPPKSGVLPFTLRRLQPGKTYLLRITAEFKEKSLSYPLLTVRTRRSCLP